MLPTVSAVSSAAVWTSRDRSETDLHGRVQVAHFTCPCNVTRRCGVTLSQGEVAGPTADLPARRRGL